MTSTIVFDITQISWQSSINWTPVAFYIAIGSIQLVMKRLYKKKASTAHGFSWFYDKLSRALPFLILALGLVVAAIYARKAHADYTVLRSAYEKGQCEITDGTIEHFVPGKDVTSESVESFEIGTRHFAYPSPGNTAGYKTTAAYGGQMKNGLHVRIDRCEGDIARIEIIDDVKPNN
ncbi:hypothetical protein ACO0LF_28280 [Undibacterium sp. Di27W]|uniref:hypothetical protein n=1 Tax=Undibacterium sp. Di27W TaxID=3413036 RepID=UPI003BF444AC